MIELISFLYILILPSILTTMLFLKRENIIDLVGTVLSIGLFLLPIIYFLLAVFLGTTFSLLFLSILATIINVILIVTLYYFRDKKKFEFKIKINKNDKLTAFLLLLIFLLYFFNFQGFSQNYWDTYISVPALFINNQKINFHNFEEQNLYSYELFGKLFDNLVDNEKYGVITKDQRLGSAVLASSFATIFGLFGFRLFYSFILVLIAIFAFLISEKLFKNYYFGIISMLLFSLNSFILGIFSQNPNSVALALLLAITFFLVKSKKPNYFLIGCFYGVLGGVRNISLLLMPLFFGYFYFLDKKQVLKNIGLFLLGSFLFVLIFLLWKQFAFGSFLMHPTQFESLQGFRPTFEHSFLGIDFEFNGLLNFPFIGKIVRTPHFAFPTFLTLILTIIKTFGILIIPLFFVGLYYFYLKDKKIGLFLLIWFLIFYLFFAPQENWEELKTTFVLLIFPPLLLLTLGGIRLIYDNLKNKQVLMKIGVFSIALLLISVVFMSLVLPNADFEKDERWFIRFPHSKEGKFAELKESQRNSWIFFHSDETSSEIEREKVKYLSYSIIPEIKVSVTPVEFSLAHIGKEYESDYNNTTIFAVWKYIYE